MNKKVFVSMLTLCVVFLAGCYVIKIFFPEQFVMAVENEVIVAVGNFIDSNKWASVLYYTAISIIFDWFYFGAVTRRLVPKLSLLIIMIAYGLGLNLFYAYAPIELVIAISSCYMILPPMFYIKELKPLSITYTVNAISQQLLLFIRDFTSVTANMSALSSFVWGIDNYIWIVICYILFNYKNKKKENSENGKF